MVIVLPLPAGVQHLYCVCVCACVCVHVCVHVCVCMCVCVHVCVSYHFIWCAAPVRSRSQAMVDNEQSACCVCAVCRVGQNCICTPYMTVCKVIPLLKLPYIHHTCVCMYNFDQPYHFVKWTHASHLKPNCTLRVTLFTTIILHTELFVLSVGQRPLVQ